MLAREQRVAWEGREVLRTPLLVPSFSSKGFPEVKKIITVMREFITEAVLVSAYDIHYKLLDPRRLTFPSCVFLDSGGYESRVEHDLSEAYGQEYKPRKWTARQHRGVLHGWQSALPTIVVSYDSPRRRSPTERQLEAACRLREDFPQFMHEFLVKPEPGAQLVEAGSVARIAGCVKQFAMVGFTEHELDHRIIGRMQKIAEIRRILDDAGVAAPVHVFGSLDSLSTVLYFVAGAEIFDGLTWLRFGFHNGQTLYRQNYGAIQGENGILKTAGELSHAMWKDNYYYLESLRGQMCNYARTGSFDSFEHIGDRVRGASHKLESRLRG